LIHALTSKEPVAGLGAVSVNNTCKTGASKLNENNVNTMASRLNRKYSPIWPL
jgi:hypothetical protein